MAVRPRLRRNTARVNNDSKLTRIYLQNALFPAFLRGTENALRICERRSPVIVLKYLLEVFGFAMLAAAASLVMIDLVQYHRWPIWRPPARLAAFSLIPILAGLSIAVVPAGMVGVRVSQISGTLPDTLYPGLHLVLPLVQTVETYNQRDQIYETTIAPDPKAGERLKVQTKEGLEIGLAVTVRFRLDPRRMAYIQANLPQPVEKQLVPPVVATGFRDLAPNYLVRELFATKREEIRRQAASAIAQKLAPDGVMVKEVMLRDIQLPAEYAKGLEGVLLTEQANEKLGVELEVKQKGSWRPRPRRRATSRTRKRRPR